MDDLWPMIAAQFRNLMNREVTYGMCKATLEAMWTPNIHMESIHSMRLNMTYIFDNYADYDRWLYKAGCREVPLFEFTSIYKIEACMNASCVKYEKQERHYVSVFDTLAVICDGKEFNYGDLLCKTIARRHRCPKCKTRKDVTGGNFDRMPRLLLTQVTPMKEISECKISSAPLTSDNAPKEIPKHVTITCPTGKEVSYQLLSIERGDDTHFTSTIMIGGKCYEYDGMRDSGKLKLSKRGTRGYVEGGVDCNSIIYIRTDK